MGRGRHGRAQGLGAGQQALSPVFIVAIEQLLLGKIQRIIERTVGWVAPRLGALLALEPLLRQNTQAG